MWQSEAMQSDSRPGEIWQNEGQGEAMREDRREVRRGKLSWGIAS